MIRRVALAAAALVLAMAAPVSADLLDVTIVDFAFNGGQVAASLGNTVRWTNNGTFKHSTTGDAPLNLWSIDVASGQARTRIFRQAGTFGFHCRFHSSMVGRVRVPLETSNPIPVPNEAVTLTVATVNAPAAFKYVIQRKAPGGTFQAWKTITAGTTQFKSGTIGTWRFRARLQRISNGAKSGWSPTLSIHVGIL